MGRHFFPPATNAQPLAVGHVWGSSRRHVDEMRTASATPRLIAPGAVRRQSHDQIIQQDFRTVLHREARQPIRTRPLADVAAQAHEDVREVDEPTNVHDERNGNIRQDSLESTH